MNESFVTKSWIVCCGRIVMKNCDEELWKYVMSWSCVEECVEECVANLSLDLSWWDSWIISHTIYHESFVKGLWWNCDS